MEELTEKEKEYLLTDDKDWINEVSIMNVFPESGKCNYCEFAFPLVIGKPDKPNNDDYGIAIHYPNFLIAYGYDIHGSGSNGVSVVINYCPMCGRKLSDKR